MTREPSPARDLVALCRWARLLATISPMTVMVGTPKAGMLAMLAARLTGAPNRIYVLRGLRAEGLDGWRAQLGITVERITCRAASEVVCVSGSLKQTVTQRRLAQPHKLRVLGSGSSNGVNTDRFSPASAAERGQARRRFGLDPHDVVVGFAGRLTRDKGVPELLDAMNRIVSEHPRMKLLVAGAEDGTDPLPLLARAHLSQPWVKNVGHISDMPEFFHAIDVFCLPSHREGFSNVNLEASSCGLPVVTTDATGCRDSILDQVTGLMVPRGDTFALSEALTTLVNSPDERSRLGTSGRAWVRGNYTSSEVWQALHNYLEALLERSRISKVA